MCSMSMRSTFQSVIALLQNVLSIIHGTGLADRHGGSVWLQLEVPLDAQSL